MIPKRIADRDFIRDWIMYVIIQFPVSSMLKAFFPPLNILLTGVTALLFLAYYIRNKFYLEQFLVGMYIAFTLLYNIWTWGFSYYEDNMLFYFPFLLLYFCFIRLNATFAMDFIKTHKTYVDIVLLFWNAMVFVSLFISGSYVYEGETQGFVSFAGTTFLLSSIAIFAFVLAAIQYYNQNRLVYLFGLVMPSLCILMGTTRTYLVVLLCAWLVFIYSMLNDKSKAVPIFVIIGILFVLIVVASPISDKFVSAMDRSSSLNMDPLEAFTSGRSVFWAYDIKAIFEDTPLNIVFGHGVNWIFILNRTEFHNPLWAHNDYIQILSDYGLVGLALYVWAFYALFRDIMRRRSLRPVIIAVLVCMWAFNAFFNMFYTYFCAALSYPFYLLLVSCDCASGELSETQDVSLRSNLKLTRWRVA